MSHELPDAYGLPRLHATRPMVVAGFLACFVTVGALAVVLGRGISTALVGLLPPGATVSIVSLSAAFGAGFLLARPFVLATIAVNLAPAEQ